VTARKRKLTLPEELFGVVWARRLRIGIPASALIALLLGAAVFVLWSQVVGRIAIAIAFGVGLMWFLFRRGDPAGAIEAVRRARAWLVFGGGMLFAGALATFAWVDQDLGLLLVVLAGAVLTLTLIGIESRSSDGPLDGPIYGDTPPYGG
jgi:hypothetical protein